MTSVFFRKWWGQNILRSIFVFFFVLFTLNSLNEFEWSGDDDGRKKKRCLILGKLDAEPNIQMFISFFFFPLFIAIDKLWNELGIIWKIILNENWCIFQFKNKIHYFKKVSFQYIQILFNKCRIFIITKIFFIFFYMY